MSKKKNSVELKLEIIERYNKEHIGSTLLSREYSINKTTINGWVNIHKKHGIAGLIPKMTAGDVYPGEFKIHVVEYMHKTNTSVRKTAEHFNISGVSTICKWERIYLEEGALGLTKNREEGKKQY